MLPKSSFRRAGVKNTNHNILTFIECFKVYKAFVCAVSFDPRVGSGNISIWRKLRPSVVNLFTQGHKVSVESRI